MPINPQKLLLVDDDVTFAETLAGWLRSKGYAVAFHAEAAAALKALEGCEFAAAILDIWMPGANGLELLREIKGRAPDTEIIMLTATATVETAIEALKCGAFDYLTKPLEPTKLANTVRQAVQKHTLALSKRALESAVSRLSGELQERHGLQAIVGKAPAMQQVYERVLAAARTRGTIFVRGESGTGKELVARAIHLASPGPERPFVPVNCAALPQDLIEAELFGHRRGAFTNADAEGEGLFAAASGGTIFLDEVTEMGVETQAKLLRVLQEKAIRPIGKTSEVPIDLRVVASTNRDPREAVARGKLREDLYYRLSVATILLPPLRERREDIPLLIERFLKRFATTHGRHVTGVERAALAALQAYNWPGNVRELENVVEQAVTFGTSACIELADLPPELTQPATAAPRSAADLSLKEAERAAIQRAIAQHTGNKSRAAEALGISRKHLYSRMRALGLDDPEG